jgi:hypothetical protein
LGILLIAHLQRVVRFGARHGYPFPTFAGTPSPKTTREAAAYTSRLGYTLDLTQRLTVMKIIWHLSRIDGQSTPLGAIELAAAIGVAVDAFMNR